MWTRLAMTALTVGIVAVMGGPALAVGVDQTIVNVDLDATTAVTETTANWPSNPAVLQKTHLVLEPQQPGQVIDDLTGVSADLRFNHNLLELVDVYELAGDINFDGFQDVGDLVTVFQSSTFDLCKDDDPDTFISYYDVNRDTCVDVGDLVTVFQSEMFDSAGGVYWTNNEGADIRESVEVFDPPAKSNTGGANAGLVDDLVSVLLLRPDSDPAVQSGDLSNNPWSGSRAIVATLVWRTKAGAAGTTDIEVVAQNQPGTNINKPVAISSTTDLSQLDTLPGPAAGKSTVTIQ